MIGFHGSTTDKNLNKVRTSDSEKPNVTFEMF
jgi:hypothetical protein